MTVRIHKRVGGAVAFGVLLVGTAVFFDTPAPVEQEAVAVVATQPRTYQETKDSDGDGIPDWEEGVSGTNPYKKNNRPTTGTDAASGDSEQEKPLTLTDRFAQRFLGAYISRKMSDAPMDDTEKQALLNSSLKEMYSTAADKPLTRADIHIQTQFDTVTIHAYGNAMADALIKYPVPSGNGNEVEILKRAIDANSEEEIRKLDPNILSYTNSIRDIRALEVPASMVAEHLAFLNSLITIRASLVAMRSVLHDPMPALVRIKGYEQAVQNLSDSLHAFGARLIATGAAFDKTESGYNLVTL